MSNRDCDVTRSGVRVVGDSDGKRLLVGDQSFYVGTRPLYVSAEDVAGDVWIGFVGGDDVAYLLKRSIGAKVELKPTTGMFGVYVSPTGRVYWVDQDAKHYWEVGLDVWRDIPIGQTATGIAYERPDGTLAWRDQVNRTKPVVDGVTLSDAYVDGGWMFAMHSDNRVLAVNPSGQLLDTGLAGNLGPKGRQMADLSAVVAVNRFGTFGESRDWTPYQPAPVTVPTFVTSPYAIGVGMFDDMTGPRLIDATEVPSGNVRAVFHHVGSGSVPASMAVAQSLGWPCLFWWDKHGANSADVPPNGRALLFGYPKDGRPVSETVAKFKADVARMKAAGIPYDVGMALYRQWNGVSYALDEQHVLDCAAAIWKAAIQATCGAVWIFSKHRTDHDGVEAFATFQSALNRMRGASPDWRTFPKYPVDATPVSEFFKKGTRFMGDAPMDIQGLRMTVGWNADTDGQGHRPIRKFLRNPAGSLEVAADRDQAGADEHMTLSRVSISKVKAVWRGSTNQFRVTPERNLTAKPGNEPTETMEEFDDVGLPNGSDEVLIHTGSGLVFEVVR